jgi:serine/threonine protein kinase
LHCIDLMLDVFSVRDVLEFQMGGLDIPSAVKVLRDAARGMDFLHKRGVVHRDLKAANLLIDEHDVSYKTIA